MDLNIRPIAEEEFAPWLSAVSVGFGEPPNEAHLGRYRKTIELDRTHAVFDGGSIVGTAHSTAHEMTTPGGSLKTACVDAVTVQPTHRRQGIMTMMMARQLNDLHDRGEPLAALWPSESIIYGRFGYGPGSFHENWSIERQHTAYAQSFERKGRTRFVSPEDVEAVYPEVYRRATIDRSGAIQPPSVRWKGVAEDPEDRRRGASAYFHVVYEQDGRVDGYVFYRTKDRAVQVHQLMAATPDAHRALWRFSLDIDLMTSSTAMARPVDDPLPWMLANPRKLKRETADAVWIRLVDLPAALSGRRYAADDSLVLGVSDAFCPWNDGAYELEAGPAGAECRPSKKSADLVLSVADLAATYLGAVGFGTLARAGKIEERAPGALDRADSMFATRTAPWCPYGF
ncbi:MAG: GNAT family N-acetyltransferase [Chloroflexi bacterium]|nr:GNAT family N-acetyltransferase [Chloroflexota bacterium]